jgi:hypothetical protein
MVQRPSMDDEDDVGDRNVNTLTESVLSSLEELKEQGRRAAPELHKKLKVSLKVKKFLVVSLP